MLKALERVRELDISMICTGHGPVLDTRIDFILDTYQEWCTVVNPNKKKTVVIPYVSAYGYTKELAGAIAQGIQESGDIDVRCYDMVEADQAKVLEELGFADGFLLGSPTIVGEAIKTYLGSDDFYFCRNPWRQAGQCFRKLRLERRGGASPYRETETVKNEECRMKDSG